MTTRALRRGGRAGLLIVLGALAAACGGDAGPTGPSPGLEVQVRVGEQGLEDVGVAVYPPGAAVALATAVTDSAGTARFPDMEPGTYDVEITVPAGYAIAGDGSARRTATLLEDRGATVSFFLAALGPGPDLVIVELVAPYAFSPAQVTIRPGATIRWVNRSDIYHTITPDGHSEWSEVEMFTEGEEFEHSFNDEGVFPYVCVPHISAGMTGTITVESP